MKVRRVFLRLDDRWVTIGREGKDGKNHGVHVFIDDNGTIVKGPKDFVGKKVGDLKDLKKQASEESLGKMTSKNTPEEWQDWLKKAPVGTTVVKYADDYGETPQEFRKGKTGLYRNVGGHDEAKAKPSATVEELAGILTGGGKVSVKNANGEKWNVGKKGSEKQKARGYSIADAYKKAGIKVDPKKVEEAGAKMPKFITFDEPELREFMKHIWAGYNLPPRVLRKMSVWKNLDNKRKQALADYGYTDLKGTDSAHPDSKRKALRNRILNDFMKLGAFSGKKEQPDGKKVDTFDGELKKDRKCVIVIGYPAAGKSSTIVNGLSQKTGSFVLDSDIIKEMFPEFQKTSGAAVSAINKEANLVRKDALNLFKRGGEFEGTNLIIPIIGDEVGGVQRYLDELEPEGYDIEIQYKRAPIELSASRLVSRAIELGRIIPLEVLDEKKNPENTFEHYKGKKNAKGQDYIRTEPFEDKKG